MRRRKAQPIGNLVLEFLRDESLESPLNEFRLLDAWAKVAGERVERVSGRRYVRNDTLYVEILSPVVRADLMMRRARLVEALNNHVGARVISAIVLL